MLLDWAAVKVWHPSVLPHSCLQVVPCSSVLSELMRIHGESRKPELIVSRFRSSAIRDWCTSALYTLRLLPRTVIFFHFVITDLHSI